MGRLRRVLDLSSPSGRSYGASTAQILLRQLLMGGRGASTPLTLVPSLLQTKRPMAHPSSQQPALAFRSSNRIDLFQCIFPVPPKGEPWAKETSPFTAQVKIEGEKEKKEENESDSPEGEVGRITCVFSRAMMEKRVNFPHMADIVFRWLLSSLWVVCEQHQLPAHLSSEGKSAHYPAQAHCSSLSLSLEILVTFR